MKTAAIILAAGQGKRMETDVPKQYLLLNGKPIIYYTLKSFEQSKVDEIVLVTGNKEIEYCKDHILQKYGFSKVTKIVAGGKERYDSVYIGLCSLEKVDYVLIHDGARPFIKPEDINRFIEDTAEYKACIAGMPVKDTIKIADDKNFVLSTPKRETVWAVQTPQAFAYSLIRKAYDALFLMDEKNVTDDAMVLELTKSYPVKLIPVSYKNIKITTPEDLLIGESFIKEWGM